jgi:hypothetical protein
VRAVSFVCTAVAALLLTRAVGAGYSHLALLHSERFADKAAAALSEPALRELVERNVADRILQTPGRGRAEARQPVEQATARVIRDPAFRQIFRASVLDAHRRVVTGEEDSVTLDLADTGPVIATQLRPLSPVLADRVQALDRELSLSYDLDERAATGIRVARRARDLTLGLVVAGLLLAVAGIALAPRRRRAAAWFGIWLALGGLALVAGLPLARTAVVAGFDERAAAGELWDVFLGGLSYEAWGLVAAGGLIALLMWRQPRAAET